MTLLSRTRLKSADYHNLLSLIVVSAWMIAGQTGIVQAREIFATGKASAPGCSSAKMRAILAPASKEDTFVQLDCSPNFKGKPTITKRLILRGTKASNITLDCKGGTLKGDKGSPNSGKDMIVIASSLDKRGQWHRPEHIRIRNCTVYGSIRIYGMDKNGEGKRIKASSRHPNHPTLARKAAPRHIWLDRMRIVGQGRIPLYLSPGATHVSLTNSTLEGRSSGSGLYLDAESGYNIFRNNQIRVKTQYREQVAIDGSSHNLFVGNRFSALGHGGIYLYRNCGEGGTIRHTPPEHNQLINNSFYYNKHRGFNFSIENFVMGNTGMRTPAIWIGSRNGVSPWCGADRGYKFGSSINDKDMARYNFVALNQIVKLRVQDMILVNGPDNIFYQNLTVKAPIKRLSGCLVRGAHQSYYVENAQQVEVFRSNPKPNCIRERYTCQNGLARPVAGSCRP